MYTAIVIVHILVCLILIGVVLLQTGKGAEMGATFGGSSQTIFGSRGAATFLSKLTVGAAVIFMVTSLTLSVLSRERPIVSTIIDQTKKAPPVEAPPSSSNTETNEGGSSDSEE
ncbi:MAG: preprotein translocase subunit SecG [Nitrospiria bacterium]